jgi:hypothetical protein
MGLAICNIGLAQASAALSTGAGSAGEVCPPNEKAGSRGHNRHTSVARRPLTRYCDAPSPMHLAPRQRARMLDVSSCDLAGLLRIL